MALTTKQIQHIYWRAGFGSDPRHIKSQENKSIDAIVDEIIQSSKRYTPIVIDLSKLDVDKKGLSKDERKALKKLSNKTMYELNVLWLKEMISTKAVLREKMAFFFHDHFATRLKNPKAALHLLNIIRKNALGNFRELLMEVSKSPAMIAFLNNKQNKKDHPNENFAREVMELFTLGRDNGYTEKDIQEAARAFTGWSYNKEGQFTFRKGLHDSGEKTVLGKTGNFVGEDIIELLLDQEQTARYLTEKLLDFFIGRTLPKERIELYASVFYKSNYDIEKLVRTILTSEDFMDEQSIGCKIKSPIELLAGISRTFDIDYKDDKTLVQLQRKLNQVLFFPPNVAGWTGGKSWIDSSTLMLRLRMSSVLLNFGVIEWDEKGDTPEQVLIKTEAHREKTKKRVEKRMKAYPNWSATERKFKGFESDLVSTLIQPELSKGAQITLENSDSISFKDRAIEILSLPEYQLF